MKRIRRVRLNDSPLALQLEEMNAAATQAGIAAGFDHRTIELIRLRCSQLNGCGACLRAHTDLALEHGEIPQRIGMLTAWRESDYFTPVEEAVLELAEIITGIGERGFDDEEYRGIAEVLTSEQISAASWIAIVINSANRLWIANNPPVRLPRDLRRTDPPPQVSMDV